MVCVPDVMAAYQKGAIDLEGVKAVQLAMIAHCELMADRVAIIDPPPDMSPQAVAQLAPERRRLRLEVRRPLLAVDQDLRPGQQLEHLRAAERPHGRHLGPQRRHPRCAQGTGQRGRAGRDRRRLRPDVAGAGAAQPRRHQLHPLVPGSWHPRLGRPDAGADETEWRYINVRRLFNYLEESILNGTQWVVFEPNDPALWARVRRTITAFLTNEWRKGALFGLTPDEAFYVKCDTRDEPARGRRRRPARLRNRRGSRQAGGVRDLPPAQFSGGAALTE